MSPAIATLSTFLFVALELCDSDLFGFADATNRDLVLVSAGCASLGGTGEEESDSIEVYFGWGLTIGAGLASYPNTTIRRPMMMTSVEAVKYRISFHAFQEIVAKEGTKSLFTNAGANILRTNEAASSMDESVPGFLVGGLEKSHKVWICVDALL
ncbi:hypothetical protein HK097_001563 [Rhizophlyctis rosea]|uniref:ADP/ATP translocase n=1 Tax=Rhizophlyctis rosea TaxID=64517 RepID=A0AAD5SJ81_9FUNG|nr:hypothetical protein HK097_001563 [Rhizophlyctis rosea]